jgi:ADP-ribosylglycohydrolase
VERLGEGWVAEEALAIALYCALTADGSFERGVLAAANHSGDSDSTAAIAGNLLGALLGRGAIPERWLEPLEVREVVERLAGELLAAFPGEGA